MKHRGSDAYAELFRSGAIPTPRVEQLVLSDRVGDSLTLFVPKPGTEGYWLVDLLGMPPERKIMVGAMCDVLVRVFKPESELTLVYRGGLDYLARMGEGMTMMQMPLCELPDDVKATAWGCLHVIAAVASRHTTLGMGKAAASAGRSR